MLVNLNVDPEALPPSWIMILASVRAGVREEIFMRLFLMTIFAWLAGLLQREQDGRPGPRAMWFAVILSAFLFGLDHIDDVVATPEIYGALVNLFLVTTMFGIVFGWLYWKQGLESAILAHFMVDAVGSGIVVPAYLSKDPLLCVAVTIASILAMVVSCRALSRRAVVT